MRLYGSRDVARTGALIGVTGADIPTWNTGSSGEIIVSVARTMEEGKVPISVKMSSIPLTDSWAVCNVPFIQNKPLHERILDHGQHLQVCLHVLLQGESLLSTEWPCHLLPETRPCRTFLRPEPLVQLVYRGSNICEHKNHRIAPNIVEFFRSVYGFQARLE